MILYRALSEEIVIEKEMAYLPPQSFIFEMTTRDIGTAKRSRQEGKVWKWDLMRYAHAKRESRGRRIKRKSL